MLATARELHRPLMMDTFTPRFAHALACLSGALLAPALSAQTDPVGAPPLQLTVVADRIVERTNELRAIHDVQAVEVATALEAASRYFADFMASTDTHSHTADGNEPAERAEAHGYDFCIVTENIAFSYREAGFPDEDALAEEIVQGWMDSPGHRRNILDEDVIEIGVAVARSERSGRYYAAQKFGRPATEAIEFSIANEWSRTVAYELDGRPFTLQPRQIRQHLVCRPPEVALSLPDDEGRAERTIHPRGGEQFAVVAREPEEAPEVVRR